MLFQLQTAASKHVASAYPQNGFHFINHDRDASMGSNADFDASFIVKSADFSAGKRGVNMNRAKNYKLCQRVSELSF